MITSIDTREYSINSWKIPALDSLDFQLPQELEAGEPPEARGLTRDQVRLLVSYRSDNRIINSQFNRLSEFLSSGDVLVINTSGTLNSALNVIRGDGTAMELHLSTELPAKLWIVELRQIDQEGHTSSYYNAKSGERFSLPGSGQVTLLTPYRPEHRLSIMDHQPSVRLWIANLDIPGTLKDYLDQHGFPIRYKYVRQGWPNSYYQTVYATEMGSAEMPSAGRAFTYELITQLVANFNPNGELRDDAFDGNQTKASLNKAEEEFGLPIGRLNLHRISNFFDVKDKKGRFIGNVGARVTICDKRTSLGWLGT